MRALLRQTRALLAILFWPGMLWWSASMVLFLSSVLVAHVDVHEVPLAFELE
jgi:hypothetical protein